MRAPSVTKFVRCLALLVALSLSACAAPPIGRYVPDGASTTVAAAERFAATADISAVEAMSRADASATRQRALDWLRQQGSDGARAATLLTEGFPAKTDAVPVSVEIAPVDGVRSLVAIEAFGDATHEGLHHRRLWIFTFASGKLTHSAAYR